MTILFANSENETKEKTNLYHLLDVQEHLKQKKRWIP